MQQRRRFKQPNSLSDRLMARASMLRQTADDLPKGSQRDEILQKAEQCDAAIHITGWLMPKRLDIAT